MATYKKRSFKSKNKNLNKSVKESTTAEVFESLDVGASKTEQIVSKYQNLIVGFITTSIFVVLAYLGYQNFILNPQSEEANNELFLAQNYFNQALSDVDNNDSLFTLALNGSEGKYGFLDIIENFQLEPLVEKLNKNKRLYLLIDKFTEFDLHPSKIDNHQMGSIYEELLRKFSEMSNEESGDHFTPRDVVKLLVNFVFGGDTEDLTGEGKIRSIFDPCCGTGGMLTVGKDLSLIHISEPTRPY